MTIRNLLNTVKYHAKLSLSRIFSYVVELLSKEGFTPACLTCRSSQSVFKRTETGFLNSVNSENVKYNVDIFKGCSSQFSFMYASCFSTCSAVCSSAPTWEDSGNQGNHTDAVTSLWGRHWRRSQHRCNLWIKSATGRLADQSPDSGSSQIRWSGVERLRAASPTANLCSTAAHTHTGVWLRWCACVYLPECKSGKVTVKPPQRCVCRGIVYRRWFWGWIRGFPPPWTAASWWCRSHIARQRKHLELWITTQNPTRRKERRMKSPRDKRLQKCLKMWNVQLLLCRRFICGAEPPVCLGGRSPDALRRCTVVTTAGWGRKHWNKEGDGRSSLSSLHGEKKEQN